MGEHPNGTSVTHTTPDGIPADPAGAGTGRPGTGGTVPWWRAWTVGTRVVVRRRLAEGGYGDVPGDLVEVGPDGVVVVTRRGPVRVAAADIALGKPVPPPPARRAPRTRPAPGADDADDPGR